MERTERKRPVLAQSGLEYATLMIQEALEVQEQCYQHNRREGNLDAQSRDHIMIHTYREVLRILEQAELWDKSERLRSIVMGLSP